MTESAERISDRPKFQTRAWTDVTLHTRAGMANAIRAPLLISMSFWISTGAEGDLTSVHLLSCRQTKCCRN